MAGHIWLRLLPVLAILLASNRSLAAETSAGSYVLRLDAFKDGFEVCSPLGPKNITGYWEVADAEMKRIDRALLHALRKMRWEEQPSLPGSIKKNVRLGYPPAFSSRQYLGLLRGDRQVVYINAFPTNYGDGRLDPRIQFISGCGCREEERMVGDFWAIEYEVKSRTFQNFHMSRSRCDTVFRLPVQ